MMGHRGATTQEEYDAFSTRGRRALIWRRGEVVKIKRRFAKRMRRIGRNAAAARLDEDERG